MADSLSKLQADAIAQGGARPSAFDGVKWFSPLFLPPQVCLPEGLSSGQLLLVIVKFLRDHPERLHEARGFLALEAAKASFPCPDKKKPAGGSSLSADPAH